MGKPIYSNEQIKFISECRLTRGYEWRVVAARFEQRFGIPSTSESMRHAFRLHVKSAGEEVTVPRPSLATHPLRDFTRDSFKSAQLEMCSGQRRYFVTAASPVTAQSAVLRHGASELGGNLFVPGFAAVQTWMREPGGELAVLPMRAHMRALEDQPSHYDPRLLKYRDRIASHVTFNENLVGLDMEINPQSIQPLTGLHRLRARRDLVIDGRRVPGRRTQSIIVAHAQQDLESLATGNGTHPRTICTTGAITVPEYLRNRIGLLASEAHILGGLIVEVEDEYFWTRQVQFGPDGSFYDLGKKYNADGSVEPARAEALRLGDLHAGREADIDTAKRLIWLVQPRRLFLEDVFDGGSINPHEARNLLSRAQAARPFRTLAEELNYTAEVLRDLTSDLPEDCEVVIVDSNHHDFLERWLQSGRYTQEPANYDIGHRMVVEWLDGINPLQKRLDPGKKWTWLGPEDDYFVEGVQMGSHGHRGADGAKGSKAQLERIHGDSMHGHLHAEAIRGRTYIVGHSSESRHGYNRAASSWGVSRGLVWPGGQKQLVRTVGGRFCMDDVGGAEDSGNG